MIRLTEFLLLYDLTLLAAANEQRGSAWIEDRTGVAVDGGVLVRDDLLALKHFQEMNARELATIWAERDQQYLLDLATEVKHRHLSPEASGGPIPERDPGSLGFTVLLLLLALAAAIALIQFADHRDFSSHGRATLIYGGALALLALGWCLGRYAWRMVRRGRPPESEQRGEPELLATSQQPGKMAHEKPNR